MYIKKSRLPENVVEMCKSENRRYHQKKARKVNEFGFFALMRYASTVERTLQILGIIACIIAGAALVSFQAMSEPHS